MGRPDEKAARALLRENQVFKEVIREVLRIQDDASRDDTSIRFEDALDGPLLVRWELLMARAGSLITSS